MIQSLERGIQALVFLSNRRTAGVTEVAEALSVNKSTAFRILETLMASNMVAQDKITAKYKLGPGILMLSERLIKNLDIIAIAKPYMIRLAERIGESAHLCMLSNDSAVVIEQIMADSRLAVHARVGNTEPVHCSSVGKCLLAFSDEQLRESILARIAYKRYTANTITDADTLRSHLEEVRARGYALDDGEVSEDIMCIAAPVRIHSGDVAYSLGISGPNGRILEKEVETLARQLIETADTLSEQLGYTG
jgi:IclR family KDG regulon transcriptional repressor